MDQRTQKQVAIALAASGLVFVGLLVAVAAFGLSRYRERARLESELQADLKQLQVRMLTRAKDGQLPTDEDIDQLLGTLTSRADKLGTEQGALVRCAGELVASQARGGRALRQQLGQIETVLAAKGLDTEGDIERRLQALGRFETLNKRVLSGLEGIPSAAERCLERHKVGAANRAAFMKGVNRTPSSRTAAIEVRRIDVEFVNASRAHLEALRAARGRFHYDVRRDVLVFDRDSDLRAFNDRSGAIHEIGQRSQDAERAVVSALEQSIARQQ